MLHKKSNLIAVLFLFIMFISALNSMKGDSLTMDELSHIPAGYSYLSQKDFRINPEHPPVIKDLAALPLLFLDINFPSQSPAWKETINGQWWYGWELLFNSNNNPDQMIFLARIPMILLLIFLGAFLFWWTRKEFGNETALLTLILFSFSPNFLAHGRLVTTDVGATLGFVLGMYFWLKFLRNPSIKNVFITGIAFGFCMLLKFSLVLLIPTLAIMTISYALLNKKNFLKYVAFSFLAGVIGVLFVILPVYLFHISNYPVGKQLADTTDLLSSSPMEFLSNLCVWMSDKPILRGLAHYLLGLLMATQRTAFGNTVYFMNMVSASGWRYYFPAVYLLKMPLAFHILTLFSLVFGCYLLIKKPFWVNTINRIKECVSSNFLQFSMVVFLLIYWGTSISGRLNIGVRHILPVFPFTYVLVSWTIVSIVNEIKKHNLKKTVSYVVIVLLFWYAFSSLSSYPYYLSYFNEIGGGLENGYKYVVDSNYDWGQDLKRLKEWVDEYNIQKIKIDYFGGADVSYYFPNRAEILDRQAGPQKGWLAISATHLQGGRGIPVHGFDQPAGYYRWLDNYEPVARAGKSIFIYHIVD